MKVEVLADADAAAEAAAAVVASEASAAVAARGRFAFAVSLAGFTLPGEREGDERMSQLAIPVFWGRGTADEVIPARAVEQTQAWLPSHSDLDQRVYEGVGHSVSDRELADVSAFLRAQYAAA